MNPCGVCERAEEQSISLKGARSNLTKIMFVLHKPDSRISSNLWDGEVGYKIALGQTKTGEELKSLLDYCHMDLDEVYLTNFFKCTLPKDLNPTAQEYRNCLGVLENQIATFDPNKIVVFSKFIQKYFPSLKREVLFMPHLSAIWALRNKEKREEKYDEVRSFLYS